MPDSSTPTPRSLIAYSVAWISALTHDRAAAEAMFDTRQKEPPADIQKYSNDQG